MLACPCLARVDLLYLVRGLFLVWMPVVSFLSMCYWCHLDRECADAAAGAQPRGPWWWRRLRCSPGAGNGSGGRSRPLLAFAREVVVVVGNQPWSQCRLCPALCELVHKEKGYSGGSRPQTMTPGL